LSMRDESLMMEAARTSETSVDNHFTRQYNPEDSSELFINVYITNVRWVRCHHGVTRPRVVDIGDSLQIWRVAANILDKESRTADSGLSSSLGLGGSLQPSHVKLNICYETVRTASDKDGLFGST
jgi:hypothetical protein